MNFQEKRALAIAIREQAEKLASLIDRARVSGLNVYVADPFMTNFENRNKYRFSIEITEPPTPTVKY